ncbi:hypothetical protein ABZT02_45720 [Streptomyces sp. NPDC005402]|uniref:hypothetical protein n=1 Tax=Streptomyces sp. NPDC005402 TaxID=3155338 RepID=UPI0033BAD40E
MRRRSRRRARCGRSSYGRTARLASAPTVGAFLEGGCDDSDGIDLDQVLGART